MSFDSSEKYHEQINEFLIWVKNMQSVLGFVAEGEAVDFDTNSIVPTFALVGKGLSLLTEIDGALDWNNRLLELARSLFGENHKAYAFSFGNIANVHYQNREYYKSIEWQNKELEWYEKAGISETDAKLSLPYERLADAYEELYDFDTALNYRQKSIWVREYSKGANSTESARLKNKLGLTLDLMSRWPEALFYFKNSLSIYEKLEVDKEPTWIYYNIGFTIEHWSGDYCEAMRWYEKELAGRQKKEAEDSINILHCYTHMAIIVSLLGNSCKMNYYLNKIICNLDKCKTDYKRSSVAVLLSNIGWVYYNIGDYNNALKYFYDALEIKIGVFGEYSLSSAYSYVSIGLVLLNNADTVKARNFLDKALAIKINCLGSEHGKLIELYCAFGRLEQLEGKYEAAISNYRQALDLCIKNCKFGSQRFGEIFYYIAAYYDVKHEHSKAKAYYAASLYIQSQILNDEHIVIEEIRQKLHGLGEVNIGSDVTVDDVKNLCQNICGSNSTNEVLTDEDIALIPQENPFQQSSDIVGFPEVLPNEGSPLIDKAANAFAEDKELADLIAGLNSPNPSNNDVDDK